MVFICFMGCCSMVLCVFGVVLLFMVIISV
jgi:hypothetical protein